MTPFAWLISLALPACGFGGSAGLPVPQPIEWNEFERPSRPNWALAAPAGFLPAPHIVTPRYDLPSDDLFKCWQHVGLRRPRTYPAATYLSRLQLHYVVRSALFNFPDLVMVQVLNEGANRSGLIIYSRSVYGPSDLGVNRRRVEAWLGALQAHLSQSSER